MLRPTVATAQWSRTFCVASKTSRIPLLRHTIITSTTTASILSSKGSLLQKTIPLSGRRYLQQNAFEVRHCEFVVLVAVSLGIYKPLAKNLGVLMSIEHPTELQQAFIPPILQHKDVLIRDTTGSGKTFGILLSVLNKPRRKILAPKSKGNGITSVVIVPNQELAFQLVEWTKDLVPGFELKDLDGLIQAVVTPPPPFSFSSNYLESTDSEKHTPTGKKKRRQSSNAASASTIDSKADQEQIQRLADNPPHVLVATPTRLWELLQRGVLDLSGIETLVLDEVDHLIRLPGRFATQKKILNRDLHPKPAELAIREIMRSAQAIGRYPLEETNMTDGDDTEENTKESDAGMIARTGRGADRIQIVAASATMNRPMRHWLESRGWVQDPTWVDTTKSVVLPKGIEHHCVVVGSNSVRNMRFEETTPSESGDKVESEVDWEETDREWKQQSKNKSSSDASSSATSATDENKYATWKEQQIVAAEAIADDKYSDAVEKFQDDDDRMLEGVAMACLLDEVKSACVFFCKSYSLAGLATRFEFDFGLSVKTIQNAFPDQQQQQQQQQKQEQVFLNDSFSSLSHTSTQLTTASRKAAEKRAGIYLAHEANARGLDLPGLSHVFIVGLPSSPSSYLHMAGRTGRMGQKGQVVTILRDDEFLEDRARSLFRMLNVQVTPYRHVE
ncbi:hypothetical protein FBU30_009568 [Linnemannia zychae]|nr:hypothetical protein FBU30_009568 [Linnemannia zychae]